MENKITVLFVSYHSDDIIEKSIMTIDKNIKIIVVENSKNKIFKNKLEEKYSNVRVLIPQENLGNGAGINYGIKHIDTMYAFYLDVDTEVFPDTIQNLISAAKQIKEIYEHECINFQNIETQHETSIQVLQFKNAQINIRSNKSEAKKCEICESTDVGTS